MNRKYILGVDQSTSGTKAVLVDETGEILLKKSKEHKQYYPNPGWVEHDATEIYDNCIELLRELIEESEKKDIKDNEIIGLSITNQRETIVLWDSITKEPVYHAIVWQCRRSTDICEDMKKRGLEETIEEKTGLKLDPYFSASKIKWAMREVDSVRKAIEAKTLRIGTIDSWLIFKLTNGKEHVTDYTNASRTMLFNINTFDWDDELLRLFEVSRWMLPEIKSSNDIFGKVKKGLFINKEIPISGVIGDSQGALFGQMCFENGMAKATYGTGSSILMYLGDKKVKSDKGLVTSIAWGIDGEVKFALEGIINSSGDTLKWVKDNLGLYEKKEEVDELISSLDSNEGVYIIPAFVGLGAPYWKADARASIVGLSRKSNKANIVRAAVESMAYQVADLIKIMEQDSATKIEWLNVDGGPTSNEFLMQLQADILDLQVCCSKVQELSVMGAIYLGGLGFGLWKDLEDLKKLKNLDKTYGPITDKAIISKCVEGWHRAVSSVFRMK